MNGGKRRAQTNAIVEVKGLQLRYGETIVLDRVHFTWT